MELLNRTPVFLISIIAFAIFVKISSLMNKSKSNIEIEQILNEERLSSKNWQKNIDESYFIKPNLDDLPIISFNDEKLIKAEQQVVSRGNAKMMWLHDIKNNTDIKNKFGFNNFNKIVLYEEQYNLFIESLINYAELLILNNYKKEAEKVLVMSYNLGSSYLKTYKLLFELYSDDKNKAKGFLDEVLNNDFLLKNQILINKISTYASRFI